VQQSKGTHEGENKGLAQSKPIVQMRKRKKE